MFNEIEPTSGAVGAPNPARTDCAWLLEPPSPFLACTLHGSRTPWHRQWECGRGPAVVCHVCLRAVVPCRHRFSWTFLCRTCTSIERNLAAPFGATALTPHQGWSGTQATTLYGMRFPDRVYQQEFDAVSITDGRPSLVSHDRLVGPNPVLRLGDWARRALGLQAGDEPMLVDEWLAAHPASPRASAEAYSEYVVEHHDWLLAEIPGITDIDWLTAVAAGAGGHV